MMGANVWLRSETVSERAAPSPVAHRHRDVALRNYSKTVVLVIPRDLGVFLEFLF